VRAAAAAAGAVFAGVAAHLVRRGREAVREARNALDAWRTYGRFWQGVRVDPQFPRHAAFVGAEVAAAGAGVAASLGAITSGQATVAAGVWVAAGALAFGASYAAGTVGGCVLGIL
jgi:hypothetical protein